MVSILLPLTTEIHLHVAQFWINILSRWQFWIIFLSRWQFWMIILSRWQSWGQIHPNGFPALSVLSWPVEWLVVIIIIILFVIFIIIAISIMMIMIGHHDKHNRGLPTVLQRLKHSMVCFSCVYPLLCLP